jgi:hypothetical protein
MPLLRARKSKSTFSTTMNGHSAHIYEVSSTHPLQPRQARGHVPIWLFFSKELEHRGFTDVKFLGLDSVMPGKWDCTFACILREQAREASCVVHLAAELHTKPTFETCWSANFMLHTHGCELIMPTGFFGQRSEHCDYSVEKEAFGTT